MDEYLKFLETKKLTVAQSGFDVADSDLSPHLFPFQGYCVRRALKAGRFAMFEDCGLGKTIQQLEWSKHVAEHTTRPVIIFAPLGVIGQTVKEGEKFGYIVTELERADENSELPIGIYIANYENLDNICPSLFGGWYSMNPAFSKTFWVRQSNKS